MGVLWNLFVCFCFCGHCCFERRAAAAAAAADIQRFLQLYAVLLEGFKFRLPLWIPTPLQVSTLYTSMMQFNISLMFCVLISVCCCCCCCYFSWFLLLYVGSTVEQQPKSEQNCRIFAQCWMPIFCKSTGLISPIVSNFCGCGFFSFQQIMGGSNHCPQEEEEEGIMGQNFKELQGKWASGHCSSIICVTGWSLLSWPSWR